MGKSTISMAIFNSYVKLPWANCWVSIYVRSAMARSIMPCIRLHTAGYGWIQPCELQIFDFVCRGAGSPAPRSFCGAFGAGRDGQRGHQDKEHVTTNTLRSSVFFSLSLSFVYFFFVFFSLYLVMPSPVPLLLPFCLVPCLFFLWWFSLFLLSAVLPFVCYVIVVLPLSSFYVFLLLYLFFPASLFSCSFYPILAMFVRFRCSASSLCFRISSFSCFPVLLLYCNNNSKSNKNSNKNNKRREQQT